MDAEVASYLKNMNDDELGLFWIIASKAAREWIAGELVRRAKDRGEVVIEAEKRTRIDVAAA